MCRVWSTWGTQRWSVFLKSNALEEIVVAQTADRQTDSSMTGALRIGQALMVELELRALSWSFYRSRGGKNIEIFSFLVLNCPLVEVSSECSVTVINKDPSCLAIIEDWWDMKDKNLGKQATCLMKMQISVDSGIDAVQSECRSLTKWHVPG